MDNVLEYAISCYELERDAIIPVNSGSNRVYKCKKDGLILYLRVSMNEPSYILAEIEWIAFLSTNVSVPRLLESVNEKIAEIYMEDGNTYIICVFHELSGMFWDKDNPTLWNESVFFNWGKTMGRMHRLTKNYEPSDRTIKRPSLKDNFVPLEHYKALPLVYKKMESIQKKIAALPLESDSYGLIHSDMHQQNLLINDNHVSVLDFDDCQYGFFALDIGIALYHAIWWGLPEDDGGKDDFAKKIISNFMGGYKTENQLTRFWLDQILIFMQYRQIDALSWFLSNYKPKTFKEVVYNDLFKINYNFADQIKFIENDIFYNNCTLDVKIFDS